ncbi:hypothetical protein COTS27_00695 [Spirochaetota bacterium]|nr:hypothetical protein COTS27_00695 [Spirochaetota bacterium]
MNRSYSPLPLRLQKPLQPLGIICSRASKPTSFFTAAIRYAYCYKRASFQACSQACFTLLKNGAAMIPTFIVGITLALSPLHLTAKEANYRADNIQILPQKNQVVLVGNATVSKKAQTLKADKIIMNSQANIAEAFGNVTFISKKDDLYYEGDYLKYYIKREVINASGTPRLENRKENIQIAADKFTGYMKKNTISTEGNTVIKIQNSNETSMLLKGTSSVYDMKKKTLTLETNVEIFETAAHQNNPDENYVITCDKAFYLIDIGNMDCYDNVKIENVEAKSIITSDHLFLEKEADRGTVSGNSKFVQENDPNTVIIKAEKMVLFRNQEKVYLVDDVFITETNQEGTYLASLECDHATNYFGDKSYLECYENTKISNFIKDSTITAGFIYYDFTKESGYAEENPVMFLKNQNNTNHDLKFTSLRMELNQKLNTVYFEKDVVIFKLHNNSPPTPNAIPPPSSKPANQSTTIATTEQQAAQGNFQETKWLTCKNAFYNYSAAEAHTFECRGKVNVIDEMEQSTLNSDRIIHDFEREISHITGNVSFTNEKNAPTSVIQGTARKIINYDGINRIVFEENVTVNEYDEANQIVSILTGDKFVYSYQKERFFEGFTNTIVEKPLIKTKIYSDHLTYYMDEERSLLEKNPIFVSFTEQNTKVLAYAKRMETFFNISTTHLKTNVHIIEVDKDEPLVRQFDIAAFKRQDYSHIQCQNGIYYYAENDTSSSLISTSTTPQSTQPTTQPTATDPSNNDLTVKTAADQISTQENTTEPLTTALKTESTFQCLEDVVITHPAENMIAYGNDLFHNLTTERSILKERPMLEITDQNITRNLFAEEIILEQAAAQTLFNGSVRMIEIEELATLDPTNDASNVNKEETSSIPNPRSPFSLEQNITPISDQAAIPLATPEEGLPASTIPAEEITSNDDIEPTDEEAYALNPNQKLRNEIRCDYAVYDFNTTDDEIFTCKENVQAIDLRDKTEITSAKIEHFAGSNYTLITGNPVFKWNKNKPPTIVKADFMERFEAENIMYAKGNVDVNNGDNQAFSSLGIYETDKKLITLYGSPKIRDTDTGDEFISKEIVFNLERNSMSMQSDVTGSILLSE